MMREIFDFFPISAYIRCMRKTVYILSVAMLSLSVGAAASACEWHSGAGGPFQSRWAGYVADQTPMDDESSFQAEEGYVPPVKVKKKPVFSKAASRASDIAKLRVERTAKTETVKVEAKAETGDKAPTVETASR